MIGLSWENAKSYKTDILVVPVCEDSEIHSNRSVAALIKKIGHYREFRGEKNQTLLLYKEDGFSAPRVLLAGMGKYENFDLEALRQVCGRAVKRVIGMKISSMALMMPSPDKTHLENHELMTAMAEGTYLGNHIYDRYKSDKKLKPLKEAVILMRKADAHEMADLPSKIETICNGTILAREWVNQPSNELTPEEFVKSIANDAEKESLKVKVMDEKEMKKKKFNAVLAVAQGSDNPPRMIVLEHRPKGAKKTVVIAGKGVCFDSGGLNVKTGNFMDGMKRDMAGGAVAAAAVITAARLNLNVNIVAIIPAVENMPSGRAIKPGDIIKTYAGKTVEIGNTDAEGRLILADAMAYGVKTYKPDLLMDIATLTGACVVALGEMIAGLFSSDDRIASEMTVSGEKTHERCWRLPLPKDYKKFIRSDFADMGNISMSRGGGAITAALFLSEFANPKIPWTHLDIAGPSYLKKPSAYCPAGATGFGVRLLIDFLEKIAQKKD